MTRFALRDDDRIAARSGASIGRVRVEFVLRGASVAVPLPSVIPACGLAIGFWPKQELASVAEELKSEEAMSGLPLPFTSAIARRRGVRQDQEFAGG